MNFPRKEFFTLYAGKPYIESIAKERGTEESGHGSIMADKDDFVPVTGVVHFRTSLGIFLGVDGLRVFIPANSTSTPSRVFEPAETVTIEVLRSYAQRKRLIA